jgi:calcineurin-like phosphoesterase family protein
MSDEIYVTSDNHWGHKKSLEFCPDSRPFSCVEELDEALIERWNSVVKPNDIIYHLGDLTWYKRDKILEILKRLNGRKFMVLGNHDQIVKNNRSVADEFEWVGDYKEIRVDNISIVMSHYPFLHWNHQHHSGLMLHGHLHSNRKDVNTMDIGVDGNNLYPYNVRHIIEDLHVNVECDTRIGRSKVR